MFTEGNRNQFNWSEQIHYLDLDEGNSDHEPEYSLYNIRKSFAAPLKEKVFVCGTEISRKSIQEQLNRLWVRERSIEYGPLQIPTPAKDNSLSTMNL